LAALSHRLQLQKGSLKRLTATAVPFVFQQVGFHTNGSNHLLLARPLHRKDLLHDRRAVGNQPLRALLQPPADQSAND
jgi:hypothetical protein